MDPDPSSQASPTGSGSRTTCPGPPGAAVPPTPTRWGHYLSGGGASTPTREQSIAKYSLKGWEETREEWNPDGFQLVGPRRLSLSSTFQVHTQGGWDHFRIRGEVEGSRTVWHVSRVWARGRGRGSATRGRLCPERPPGGAGALSEGRAWLQANGNPVLKVLQGVVFLNQGKFLRG